MVEQNSWLKKKMVRPLKQGKKARPSNNMGDNSVLTPCLKGTELSLATSLHLNKSRAFKKASQSRDKRVLEILFRWWMAFFASQIDTVTILSVLRATLQTHHRYIPEVQPLKCVLLPFPCHLMSSRCVGCIHSSSLGLHRFWLWS